MAIIFTFSISGIINFTISDNRFLTESYFDSNDFQEELYRFSNYLAITELNPLTKEKVIAEIEVTNDEIREHRYRYGYLDEQLDNIMAQYEERIMLAEGDEATENGDALIKERDDKLNDIRKNFESDDHIANKIKKEKEREVEQYFSTNENFKPYLSRFNDEFIYYFSDDQKFYSNVEIRNTQFGKEYFSDDGIVLYADNVQIDGRDFFNEHNPPYEDWLYRAIVKAKGEFSGQIGVPTDLAYNSEILKAKRQYDEDRQWFWGLGISSSVLLILWSFSMIKMVSLPNSEGRFQAFSRKTTIDIRLAVFLLLFFFTILGYSIIHDSIYLAFREQNHMFMTDLILSIIITSILTLFLYELVRHHILELQQEEENPWKKSLLWKFGSAIPKNIQMFSHSLKAAFLNKSVGFQTITLLSVVFALGVAGIIMFINPFFFIVYMFLLLFIGLPFFRILLKQIGNLNKISIKIEEMAAGKLGGNLEIKGISVLAKMAANVNQLKQEVRVSQSEQAKSERLKTELITNVSHDLRTPLTSIITYTELLKKNNLSHEDQTAYLEIIDRKSQRLKSLIDDLFEVSKMASGNIEIMKERVDINQLLQQALAEYGDTLQNSNLHFRVSTPDTATYAMVDGQKIWRVFDNLIGNILKYSLENSRVYIIVKQHEDNVLISFKNVSKYELNDQSEELYERFKRGDTSRHTDGSGLGLAIAKSIIDLHEGSLDIETDGDLFKVTIKLSVVM